MRSIGIPAILDAMSHESAVGIMTMEYTVYHLQMGEPLLVPPP